MLCNADLHWMSWRRFNEGNAREVSIPSQDCAPIMMPVGLEQSGRIEYPATSSNGVDGFSNLELGRPSRYMQRQSDLCRNVSILGAKLVLRRPPSITSLPVIHCRDGVVSPEVRSRGPQSKILNIVEHRIRHPFRVQRSWGFPTNSTSWLQCGACQSRPSLAMETSISSFRARTCLTQMIYSR